MFNCRTHKGAIVAKILLIGLLYLNNTLHAQPDYTVLKESQKLLGLSLQFDYGVYRDFSTSPLFYEMPGIGFSASGIFQSDKNENRFDLEGDFLFWNSIFVQINTYYHYIHRVPVFKNPKWDLKVGGAFLYTQNVRNNSALMNAQLGFESLAHLMLVGKMSRDLSRMEQKDYKFWFIKGRYKPIKRMISLQMNIGVLNLNHRPSTYNYVYFGAINGSELSLDQFFEEYQWRLNGWRLGARIEYSWFYPSGNGRKIAYIWDAAHAPGTFEPFDMATHKLQFTILINNKK
ncbi:MAG TPA: hypothetical protein PLI77_02780 [Bacteroidales bacterium]|nr:hypothetical protein [Bacteroidales bacterium]